MPTPGAEGEASSASLTDLEELMRLKKVLSKALPSPVADGVSDVPAGDMNKEDDMNLVLDVLNTLETFNITRNLLAKSRIGLAVGALRRHSNPQVRSKSAALVGKWKTIISSQTPKPSGSSSSSSSSNNSRSSDAAAASTVASAASTTAPSTAGSGSGAAASAAKKGKVGVSGSRTASASFPGPFTGDSTRDKARMFLWRALVDGLEAASAAGTTESSTAAETGRVAAAIEGALWQRFIVQQQSTREYNSQLKTLKWNLADPKNPDLNLKVLWGMYTAEQLASMSSAELASDEKKREREQQKQESLEACQSDWEVRRMLTSGEAAQGQFPCFKCRTNKTVYFQMQTRSSDEPMTTFVTCLECGNRWKF